MPPDSAESGDGVESALGGSAFTTSSPPWSFGFCGPASAIPSVSALVDVSESLTTFSAGRFLVAGRLVGFSDSCPAADGSG